MQIYNMKSIHREEMIELPYFMHAKKLLSHAGGGLKTFVKKFWKDMAVTISLHSQNR
jgi:hypothetical protein